MRKVKVNKVIVIVYAILSFVLLFVSCGNKEKRLEAAAAYISAVDSYEAENFAESLEHTRRAIKLDNGFYQAKFLEGKNLFFSGKTEEAEKVFSKLVSKHPSYTEARIWHIRCLIQKNDFQNAQKMLDKELSYNQTDWRIFSLYSTLARKTENYEERLAMNRRAESVLTDSARIYIDMAITWHSLGLRDRAQTYLEKARSVSGLNIPLRELEGAVEQILMEWR